MTPDDIATIRTYWGHLGHGAVTHLCDALERAWGEIGALQFAARGQRARAERAEADSALRIGETHLKALADAVAALARVKALCDDTMTSPCDDHCRIHDIRAAIEEETGQ